MDRRTVLRGMAGIVIMPGALKGCMPVAEPSPPPPSPPPGGNGAGISFGHGILWESDVDLARDLDHTAASGAKWVRFDFPWSAIERVRGQFDWWTSDRVVEAAHARGLQVVAMPAYTPRWARPDGTDDKHGGFDPADFAAFVGAAVARYAPQGVRVWEIWNEPNQARFWKPRPDPVAYTEVLKASYAAVHRVDPDATVMSGGLAPAVDAADGWEIAPATFLSAIYRAGGSGRFDAVGMHPYSYPARPMDPSTAHWNTFYRLPEIHEVMQANGDGHKSIWSTEFGAPTGESKTAVSEAEQAAILQDAYAAIKQWPWAGPLLWYSLRDAGTDLADREDNFGLLGNGFQAKPALAAFASAIA